MKLILLLFTILVASCSNSNVAGNSSETGNCRIVGIASFSSTLPADSLPVVLTPPNHTGLRPDIPDTVWTNEYGEFSFDTVDPGEWTISVVDSEAFEGLIRQGISLELGDTITVTDTMELLGAVSVNRSDTSDSVVISMVGTPWSVILPAGDSSVLIPLLPTNEPISIAVQSGNSEYLEDILVQPLDTIEVAYEKRLLVLHGANEQYLFERYKPLFTTAGFTVVNEIAEMGDIETYDEYDVIFLLGYPELNAVNIEFLLSTETSVISAAPMTFPLLNMTKTEVEYSYGVTSANEIYLIPEHEIILNSGVTPNVWLPVVLEDQMSFGLPLPEAENLATILSNASSGLFVYDPGDSLTTGVASGKRIGIFANGFELTDNGGKLLVSTLNWAAQE